MIIKIYQAAIQLTLPIMVEGKPVYVTFSEEKYTYCTANPAMQKALEATGEFNKKFKLKSSTGTLEEKKPDPVVIPSKSEQTGAGETGGQAKTDPDPNVKTGAETGETKDQVSTGGVIPPVGEQTGGADTGDGKKQYPDVVDFQTAKDVLRKEHGVAHQSLNSPENILKKADEVGVLFPNLKL